MVKGEAIRVINYDDFFFHVSRKMERKLLLATRTLQRMVAPVIFSSGLSQHERFRAVSFERASRDTT